MPSKQWMRQFSDFNVYAEEDTLFLLGISEREAMMGSAKQSQPALKAAKQH